MNLSLCLVTKNFAIQKPSRERCTFGMTGCTGGGGVDTQPHDGDVQYITSEVTCNVTSEKPLQVSYKWDT